jgi:hypothetical protein
VSVFESHISSPRIVRSFLRPGILGFVQRNLEEFPGGDLNPQNIGSPPRKDLDMASRKWTQPLLTVPAKLTDTVVPALRRGLSQRN